MPGAKKKIKQHIPIVTRSKYWEKRDRVKELEALLSQKETEINNLKKEKQPPIDERKIKFFLLAEERQKEIEKLKKQLAEEKQELTQQTDQLKAEIKKLKQRREDSGYGDDAKNPEAEELTAENRELRERIKQFEKELAEEKKKHEDYLNKKGNLRILAEDRKKSLKIEELENEKQVFQKQINDLNEQIDSLSEDNDELQEDFFENVKNNRRKVEQISDLENKLSEKGRIIQELVQKLRYLGESSQIESGVKGINSNIVKNSLGWKSALWQKTKKFGLTALAAYGSYQVGYNYGSNSCSTQINQPGLVHLNNTSLIPQNISVNQTHSWVENPLLNPFFSNNFHSDLENFTPPPQLLFFENNLDQLNTVFAKLGMAASIDTANPEPFKEVIAKLADLETKLGKLDELDTKLGGANLTDITTNLKDLINQNASLQTKNNSTRPETAKEFTHYKSPEQVAEIEKSVREKVQKEFKDYINPNNSTALAENKLFTKSQVEQEMKNKAEQKDREWKNKGLINPQDDNDLLSAQLVKKANLTAAENERDNRPNITLSEYNNLLNKQKPKDLPDDWKNQSVQAAKNQNILDTITNILPELIDKAGKFKEKKVSKILGELKSRPKQTDLDNKVNEAIAKYKDYIEPTDTAKIIDLAKAKGYQFQQKDIDSAIKTNNQTWIDKGLVNPLNPYLVPKTDLLEAQRKIKLAEEFGLTDWQNIDHQTELETLTTLLARPTQKELEDKQKKLVETNQQVNNLTTQLNKLNTDLLKVKENSRFEVARLESESQNYKKQRDLRPDVTFTEYQQLLTDKNEAEKTRKAMQIERDDALRSLDAFNDQLNDIYQESVRGKRKERKLNGKLNQKTKPAENFQSFREQTHTQTNFLHSLFNCLVSAGVGVSGGYASQKSPPKIDMGELDKGINTLIEQRNQFQKEKEDWKNKFLSHECEVPAPAPCSHSDIFQNNYKPQVEIIQQENEQAIIWELNNTLQLGLGSNPNLKQVISRIQELINKDPVEINTPFGESLQVIKELEINSLEQLFPNQLETSFLEQIKTAQNYQQLTQIRNEFLAKHLNGEVKQISEPIKVNKKNVERYVWISLLVSLVVGLLMAIKSLVNAKKSKRKVLSKVFKLIQKTRSRKF